MKKILYFLSFIGLLWACDPMEDTYNKLDDSKEPYHGDIAYTLAAADYSTAAGYANAVASTRTDSIWAKADSTWAGYVLSYQAFNDTFPGSEYIPKILSGLFPAYNFGSTAQITYNYFDKMPEDLSVYADAGEYSFSAGDYARVDSLTGITGYLYPDFNPEFYIPAILTDAVSNPQKDDIIKVNYKYSYITPVFPQTAPIDVYSESFASDLSGVDTFSVVGDNQKWYFSSYQSNTYAKISGYVNADHQNYDNEDWLVTPNITLNSEKNIILNITQALNYLNDSTYQIDILVSTDYTGDITTAHWTSIKSDVNMPSGNNWNFTNSGDVSLNQYGGQTINIAFKYMSSSNNAATWEVSNIKVIEGDKILGEPYELNDIYKYDNGIWVKMKEVHYLNPQDYDAMGNPGDHDNFSSSMLPLDYIPKYLNNIYPTAGEGVSAIVIYKYYTKDFGTLTIADKYTYTSGEWVSSYNFIGTKTDRFFYSENGWIFDPTVRFTMDQSDYQLVVDYVMDVDTLKDFANSYGNTESYFGASAYKYYEFNILIATHVSNEPDIFANLTDEQANAIIMDRVRQAIIIMLQKKFPYAVALVQGVEVHYVVTTTLYDTKEHVYTYDFKCTSDGTDTTLPTFELVSDPILQ